MPQAFEIDDNTAAIVAAQLTHAFVAARGKKTRAEVLKDYVDFLTDIDTGQYAPARINR